MIQPIKQFRVTRLTISGFKGYADQKTFQFGGMNVISGHMGVGKSSIADAIAFAASRELFNGTGENAFDPAGDMTRAMILTVLARYDGQDTTGGSSWYEQGAQWAVENGVSDGTSLNSTVSREQLVTMLWRYAGSPAAETGLDSYADSAAVSDWSEQAMAWAVENGLITGTGAGALNPQGTATRAEVAAILARFVENVSF